MVAAMNDDGLKALIEALEHRLGVLEDVHAIRRLQHLYAYFIDKCPYDEAVVARPSADAGRGRCGTGPADRQSALSSHDVGRRPLREERGMALSKTGGPTPQPDSCRS